MFTSVRVRIKYKRLNLINRRWHVPYTITNPTNINFAAPAMSQGCKTYCEKATKTQ